MQKLIFLFKKYRELILYVFFGGCTTLVNIVSYFLSTRLLHLTTSPATILAWILSVLFAYVTNRRWVFESTARGASAVIKEMGGFFGARLATGLMDLGIMFLFVDLLGLNDLVIKITSNVLVIVANYVLSKLFVFRKK